MLGSDLQSRPHRQTGSRRSLHVLGDASLQVDQLRPVLILVVGVVVLQDLDQNTHTQRDPQSQLGLQLCSFYSLLFIGGFHLLKLAPHCSCFPANEHPVVPIAQQVHGGAPQLGDQLLGVFIQPVQTGQHQHQHMI